MTNSDTRTPDAPRTPEFEGRARALLARYADEAPATAQTEARVRELLAAPETASGARGTRAGWRPPRLGGPRGGWALGAISLGLVAALIIGFFGVTWLRSRSPVGGKEAGCSEMQVTDSDGNSSLSPICPVEGARVSVAVAQSYADPTRTALNVRIATPGAFIPHGQPIVRSKLSELMVWKATLTDEQGHTYSLSAGSLDNTLFTYDAAGAVATGVLEFDPLPQEALTAPRRLTLHISNMTAHTAQLVGGSWGGTLNGSWATTFQVTPQAGRSITFNVAPQTHQGVTVQPLRLDVGPDANVFDGYGGGERLLLRISGLPPSSSALAVAGFATSVTTHDGSSATSGYGSKLLLEGREPAGVGGVVGDASLSEPIGPLVGPSGTLVLDVIFISPRLPMLAGAQTLSIDEISTGSVAPMGAIKGPWTFELPLG